VPLLRIGGLFILSLLAASSLFAQKDDSALLSPVEVAGEQYQAGKLDDALATLDRLEKSLSPTMESQDLRGRVYLEQGKFDEAMRAFEAAHARKYEAFAPKIHVADALRRQKKFKEARAEYDKLVEIKAPMWPEYARFGVLVCYLAEHDEDRARRLVETIVFPSGSPVYYYAQAAWAFAHGKDSEGRKWIASAKKIFDVSKTSWFERGLYELGWIKKKPPLTVDTFL
jgi:tetratricopeptide (TPR) repeat protein